MDLTPREAENLELARRYVLAVQDGATGERLAAFLHPEVEAQELPNRLVPNGGRSDLAGMLAAAERGQKNVRAQRYEVLNALVWGEAVALEVDWSGTLAVPLVGLPAGYVMRARFAMFLELRDGRIYRVRNYDCFEPW